MSIYYEQQKRKEAQEVAEFSAQHVQKLNSFMIEKLRDDLMDMVTQPPLIHVTAGHAAEIDSKGIKRFLAAVSQYMNVFETTSKDIDTSPRKETFWVQNLQQQDMDAWRQALHYYTMLYAAYGKEDK
jgi:putative protein kinase ArgK-like GTPase of G3E family